MNYYERHLGDYEDSPEVVAIKERLHKLIGDHSDSAKRHRKWLQSQIRAQRLTEAKRRGTHTEDEWLQILDLYDSRCVVCGCRPVPRPCKDHIVPICMGGSDAASNLQPMCRECNTSKGLSTFNWAKFRDDYGFEGDEQ